MASERSVQNDGPGFGWRLAILGSIATATGSYIAVRSSIQHNVSELGTSYFPRAAGVVFIAMVFIVNPLLRLAGRRWTLSRADLLISLGMMLIGVSLSTMGFTQYFLSILMAPFYFASPSNQWWNDMLRHGPLWLFPRDANAIAWFWEGLPGGESIPWGTYLAPGVFWTVFILSLYAMMFAVVMMLRKQWVENERLIYPLMEPPLLLMDGLESGAALPAICRNRLFWIGFALVLAPSLTVLIHYLNPNFEPFRVFHGPIGALNVSQTWTQLPLYISPMAIGFACFVKRDVLISLWLFSLLGYLERNILRDIGYAGPLKLNGEINNVITAWQCGGALVVYVGASLFMARGHLKQVFRKALTNDPTINDSHEPMRYRSMTMLLAVSASIVFVFLVRMGMAPVYALTFMAVFALMHLAAARFVCEGGLLWGFMPFSPFIVLIGLYGAREMPIQTLAAVAIIGGAANAVRVSAVAGAAQSLKLAEAVNLRRGAWPKAAAVAVLVAILFSSWLTLSYSYDKGALNSGHWGLRNAGKQIYSDVIGSMNRVPETDPERLVLAAGGAGAMALLTIARYTIPWWPIHPIGLPLALGYDLLDMVLSLFIAWGLKTILIRLGGLDLYNRWKPFFIGLIVSSLFCMLAAFVAAWIQGEPGIQLP